MARQPPEWGTGGARDRSVPWVGKKTPRKTAKEKDGKKKSVLVPIVGKAMVLKISKQKKRATSYQGRGTKVNGFGKPGKRGVPKNKVISPGQERE